MKRRSVMFAVGVLLLFGLTAAIQGGRVKSDSKMPASVSQEAQATKAAPTSVTASSQTPTDGASAEIMPSIAGAADANDYSIPWLSTNGGGGPLRSTSYSVNASVGQSVIGSATSANYEAGIGYWYGICVCDCHADPGCDGLLNILDVVYAVDVAFRGGSAIPDPNPMCPFETTDVDCDGDTDILDVTAFVNVAFRGGDPAVEFCGPCAP